jgi:hypothetical protein
VPKELRVRTDRRVAVYKARRGRLRVDPLSFRIHDPPRNLIEK